MKYRYIIINEDNSFRASNNLPEWLKESFDDGIVDIIDCEHGEIMTNFDPEEWEDIGRL